MKTIFTLLHLLLFLSSYAQHHDYIDNPSLKDTLCKKDLIRAKNDLASGKLKFCEGYTWDFPHSRMFPQLDSICKTYGLIFSPDSGVERDVQFMDDPNTYTCYSDFMDREIANRFGTDFKNRLRKQADSIFINKALNDTIAEYECDIRPYGFTDWECEFFSMFGFPENCPLKTNCQHCQIRVDFVIDTTGKAINFSYYFAKQFPLSNSCKHVYEREIWIALDKAFIHRSWSPGIISNRKVASTVGYLFDLLNHDIR